MQQTPNERMKNYVRLGFSTDVSKVVFAINLCRMHDAASRRLANFVVGNSDMLFLKQVFLHRSILDNAKVIPEQVRGVLDSNPQTTQHVADRKNLFHSGFHGTKFRTVSGRFNRPLSLA